MGKQVQEEQLCPTCSEASLKTIVAARSGHLPCLRSAYDSSPAALNERDHFSATPLHYAARKGHLECLRWLCAQSGVSASTGARNGATPAHDAAATGHVECLRFLLENQKVDVSDKTNEGATIFHLACRFGRTRIVKFLLDTERVSVAEKGANNVTGVHIAAAKDNLSCVKILTRQRDYEPNVETSNGATPVYFAAQEGSFRCLRWLIERCHGDPLKRAADGMAPIHAAASSGHLDCLRYLVEKVGISDRMPSTEGATPLHYAAGGGQLLCVEWLLNRMGDKILDRDKSGGTPVHDAAELGQTEVVRLFMRRGFNVKLKDDDGLTPYELAKESGHEECMVLLSGVAGRRNDLDLRNPGAAIRKAAEAARRRLSRTYISSSTLEEISQLKDTKFSTPEPAPPPDQADDIIGGTGPATPTKMNSRRQSSGGNAVIEPAVQDTAEAVTSDDDSAEFVPADSARRWARSRSLLNFFTGLRRRLSTSTSPVNSPVSSPPLSPSSSQLSAGTFGDEHGSATQRKKSKLSRLKELWTSPTNQRHVSRDSTSPEVSPKEVQSFLPSLQEAEVELDNRPATEQELHALEEAEAAENATPDLGPRSKKTSTVNEHENEQKKREFEAMMFGDTNGRNQNLREEAVEEPQTAAVDLARELAEKKVAKMSAPEDDESENDDPLVKAMECGLEETDQREFNGYDADSEDDLDLLEQESEAARLESRVDTRGDVLQETIKPSADTADSHQQTDMTDIMACADVIQETDSVDGVTMENNGTDKRSAENDEEVCESSTVEKDQLPAEVTNTDMQSDAQNIESALATDIQMRSTNISTEGIHGEQQTALVEVETSTLTLAQSSSADHENGDAEDDEKVASEPAVVLLDHDAVNVDHTRSSPTEQDVEVHHDSTLEGANQLLLVTAQTAEKDGQADSIQLAQPRQETPQDGEPRSSDEASKDAKILPEDDTYKADKAEAAERDGRQLRGEEQQSGGEEQQSGGKEQQSGGEGQPSRGGEVQLSESEVHQSEGEVHRSEGEVHRSDSEGQQPSEPAMMISEQLIAKDDREIPPEQSTASEDMLVIDKSNAEGKQVEETSQNNEANLDEMIDTPGREEGDVLAKNDPSEDAAGVHKFVEEENGPSNEEQAKAETVTNDAVNQPSAQPTDSGQQSYIAGDRPQSWRDSVIISDFFEEEKEEEVVNDKELLKDVDADKTTDKAAQSAFHEADQQESSEEDKSTTDATGSFPPIEQSVPISQEIPTADSPEAETTQEEIEDTPAATDAKTGDMSEAKISAQAEGDMLNSANSIETSKPSSSVLPSAPPIVSSLSEATVTQDDAEPVSSSKPSSAASTLQSVSEESTGTADTISSKVHSDQQDFQPPEQTIESVSHGTSGTGGRRARRAQRVSKRIDSLISNDYLESISDANLHTY